MFCKQGLPSFDHWFCFASLYCLLILLSTTRASERLKIMFCVPWKYRRPPWSRIFAVVSVGFPPQRCDCWLCAYWRVYWCVSAFLHFSSFNDQLFQPFGKVMSLLEEVCCTVVSKKVVLSGASLSAEGQVSGWDHSKGVALQRNMADNGFTAPFSRGTDL